MSKSQIQRLYEDKVVFLTGGTGFLGSVIIEKLLRSCPDIGKIYLLVREKKGLSPKDRLEKLTNNTVFCRLKNEQPKFSEKLKVIHGDLTKPRLGLSQNDEALVVDHTEIVLHPGATIVFNKDLKTIIETNVTATRELCHLSQKMAKLKAFVYVSTAYSNCEKDFIPEKVLPPVMPPESVIRLPEVLDEHRLDAIAPKMIQPKLNNYIFTKSTAENIVLSYGSTLPVAIFRPAIVGAAVEEPVPGFLTTPQSATAIIAAFYAGLLRSINIHSESRADIVPVDKVANGIIALSYTVASQKWKSPKDGEDIPVINYVAKSSNCLTLVAFIHLLHKPAYDIPSQRPLWYPFMLTPHYRWLAQLNRMFLHYLPAIIVDFVLVMIGKPAKLRKIYEDIHHREDLVSYFGVHHFQFEEKNTDRLWNMLEPQDQQLFPCNMEDMRWADYVNNYILGVRRYLLKEDDSTLERARFRTKVLYSIHLTTKCILILIACKATWSTMTLLGFTL